jgi:hypothetical protein
MVCPFGISQKYILFFEMPELIRSSFLFMIFTGRNPHEYKEPGDDQRKSAEGRDKGYCVEMGVAFSEQKNP